MRQAELLNITFEALQDAGQTITRDQVRRVVFAFCDSLGAELLAGGEAPLPQLGKLKVLRRSARKCFNPHTGEEMMLPEGKRVVFRACKELRDAL